jgi:5-methylcytosine-specific restriction endonuclease McrA
MEAARTARRFPVVLDLLMSGDVTMTTVALLNKYLTEENHLGLLDAARHKTKGEVLAQIAEFDPRPDLDSLIVPLGDGRFRLEITVPREAYRDLQSLQNLLRHSFPTGDPALIVAHCLSQTRAHVERRKLADVPRPRNGAGISRTRHVPAAVKREVWTRDGGQCAFVGTAGRCPEQAFLELHHVTPFAAGGPSTAQNLQLRCRAHNNYEAEQYFGIGQQQDSSASASPGTPGPAGPSRS